MFGKGDGFPDSTETRSMTYLRAMLYCDYRKGEVFPAMLPKIVKMLWGPFPIVIFKTQVVQGNFSLAKRRSKTVTGVVNL